MEGRNMEGYSRVANFIDADNKRWNREVLLSQIDLPLVQAQDKLLWTGESEGKFSVKTSYEAWGLEEHMELQTP